MKIDLKAFLSKLGLLKQDRFFCAICNSVITQSGDQYIRSCEHVDAGIVANVAAHTTGISKNKSGISWL